MTRSEGFGLSGKGVGTLKPARTLKALALLACAFWLLGGQAGLARSAELEKDQLKIGFIKLTDMAPLAIANEKLFFEDEGLQVLLEAQANWKVLLDRVITGELDGAHMLAGQPLAATIGYGTKAELITAISMDLNGNAITLSNDVFEEMKKHLEQTVDGKIRHPISAAALKPVVDRFRADGRPFNMGMSFPVSTHNYELCEARDRLPQAALAGRLYRYSAFNNGGREPKSPMRFASRQCRFYVIANRFTREFASEPTDRIRHS